MLTDIEALLYSSTIADKIELTKVVKRYGNNDKFKAKLIDHISDYIFNLNEDIGIRHYERFFYYGPSKGLAAYVATQLHLSLHQKKAENRLFVLDQLLQTLNDLSASKRPLLKMTKTKELINLISSFLGDNFYRIIDGRHCSIYYIPYENSEFNASFDSNTKSVIVFRTKESGESPEYVFAHEVGHMVHNLVFGYPQEVPPSFIEFNNTFNAVFFAKLPKDEQVEIYADFFSIALMIDTPYEKYNPFVRTFRKSDQIKIKEYFINEFKRNLIRS